MQSCLSSSSTNLFIFPPLAATDINTFSCARAGEHQWPEQSREWGIIPQFAHNMESPQHDDIVGTIKSAKFNFRDDYQLDSDIVSSYTGLAPSTFSTLQDSVHRQTGLFKPYLPYEQRHVHVEAAWVAQNCRSSNHREQFVEAVMGAGVRVDSFGGCLHNKDFPAGYQDTHESFIKLLSKYKFYLSFENSLCRHYYTEKLFRSLEIGVIPILLNHPADSEYLLPHKVCQLMPWFLRVSAVGLGYQLCIARNFHRISIANQLPYHRFCVQDAAIKVWDFPNVQALARYILEVSSSPTLFYKHLAWKSSKMQDLSPQFVDYWSRPPASGDGQYVPDLPLFCSQLNYCSR